MTEQERKEWRGPFSDEHRAKIAAAIDALHAHIHVADWANGEWGIEFLRRVAAFNDVFPVKHALDHLALMASVDKVLSMLVKGLEGPSTEVRPMPVCTACGVNDQQPPHQCTNMAGLRCTCCDACTTTCKFFSTDAKL